MIGSDDNVAKLTYKHMSQIHREIQYFKHKHGFRRQIPSSPKYSL